MNDHKEVFFLYPFVNSSASENGRAEVTILVCSAVILNSSFLLGVYKTVRVVDSRGVTLLTNACVKTTNKPEIVNRWHDQRKWITCRKISFSIFFLHHFPITHALFGSKPHNNWISGYRVMKNLSMLKQYKTKEFEHCSCQNLKNNMADIQLIPLDQVTYLKKIVYQIFYLDYIS